MSGYECSNCHGVFAYEDGWTDDDAIVEADAAGFLTGEPLVVICDDCYRGMGLLQALLPPSSLQPDSAS